MTTGRSFNAGGSGKDAYFQQGSLQLVVIPEPGALVLAAVLRRRLRR